MKDDIFFLQETHSTARDQKVWLAEWGGGGIFSHGRSNSRGVCILYNTQLSSSISKVIRDDDGRYIILQLSLKDETYTLVNIYAPTQSEYSDQIDFLLKLEEELSELEVHNLILGGDFNVQLAKPKPGREERIPTSYPRLLGGLLNTYNLVDIRSRKHPNCTRATFHRGSYSAKLDYWFIPEVLADSVSSTSITPHALSDHSLIQVHIGFPSFKRGPGFWKFPNILLSDDKFKEEMAQVIVDTAQEEIEDPNVLWEWIKHKIRDFTIQFTIRRNRDTRKVVQDLQARLVELAENHDMKGSEDILLEVRSIKRELGEIAKLKATTALFRSKARWAMLGEKPTAYFLGLEKRASKDKTILSLKDDAGCIISDNSEILEIERRYYERLFTEDPDTLDDIENLPLREEDVPKISDISRRQGDQPFTNQEFFLSSQGHEQKQVSGF